MPNLVQMSNPDALRDDLRRFGFSEKEIDVYLSLVERGSAEPKTLASDAGVSTSYIYEVVTQLDSRNLVRIEEHQSPTVVHARRPDKAFQTLSARLDRIEDAVEERYQQPRAEPMSLGVIQSRPTFASRLRELISQADSEIRLSLPFAFLSEVEASLKSAVEDGVFVVLVLSESDYEARSGAVEDVATVVNRIDAQLPAYVAIDDARGLIAPLSVLAWEHGPEEAIEFTNPTVTGVVSVAFFGLYQSSTTVMLLRPNTLPRRYSGIRPAVYDAELARRRGRSLHLRATVRPTGVDDETETIEGPITEIRQSLIAPTNSELIFENAFEVDVGNRRVSIGGVGAFMEDYEATSLLLYADT